MHRKVPPEGCTGCPNLRVNRKGMVSCTVLVDMLEDCFVRRLSREREKQVADLFHNYSRPCLMRDVAGGEYDFINRMGVVARLADVSRRLCRIRLMKYMYLLQTVRAVPLAYHFHLYAHGPYDPTVLNDLGNAEAWGAVTEMDDAIRVSTQAQCLFERAAAFLQQHEDAVGWVTSIFDAYSAAELEVVGILVWAGREMKREDVAIGDIVKLACDARPKFHAERIRDIAYNLARVGAL